MIGGVVQQYQSHKTLLYARHASISGLMDIDILELDDTRMTESVRLGRAQEPEFESKRRKAIELRGS